MTVAIQAACLTSRPFSELSSEGTKSVCIDSYGSLSCGSVVGLVTGICPTNSNQLELLEQVKRTKIWSLQLDFLTKSASSHDVTCPCNLLLRLVTGSIVPSCVLTFQAIRIQPRSSATLSP